MNIRDICAVALAASLILAVCGTAGADILYFDDFDGSSATNLNGTTPDIRPGTTETWSAHSDWKADGTKSTGNITNAFLPFTPVAGKKYVLSLDVNPISSSTSTNDWFAVGFSDGSSLSNWHNDNSIYAWMLNRINDAQSDAIRTFRGAGTNGAAEYDPNPDKVGFVNLRVVLNTFPSSWTVEWFVDGASIRGPVSYSGNPTSIDHVGFAAWRATGVVDNFLLETVPEPSTLAMLLGLGGVGLLGYLRRRRRQS